MTAVTFAAKCDGVKGIVFHTVSGHGEVRFGTLKWQKMCEIMGFQ
jgi:hypothetical protein